VTVDPTTVPTITV